MKVLFLNHAGVLGGATVSMVNILNALRLAGDKVEIVCRSTPHDTIDMLLKNGYTQIYPIKWVMSHPYYNGGVTNRLSLSYWNCVRNVIYAGREIERIIAQSDCDVVMVNSITLFYVGKIAKAYGKKAICFQRETLPQTNTSKKIRKIVAETFDGVVFISSYDLHQFDLYPHILKKVIYDKINVDNFANLDQREAINGGKRILFMGGISQLKGTHIAIEALKYLPGYILSIVSGGRLESPSCKSNRFCFSYGGSKNSYLKKCSEIASKSGVLDRLEYLPPIQNVEQYYQNADVVVFSPTVEHQTRLIYETGAAKKPIVVPDIAHLDEFSYGHVFRFKMADPASCACAILKAVKATVDYEEVCCDIYAYHDSRTLDEELKGLLEEIKRL